MTREEAKDYIREWCPYDRQEEIIKALEQEPTRMIDKSNFSQEQYKADLQCAYDCGKSILDKIRAEIKQRPYGIANDSVIQGEKYERAEVLEIIDKYKVESEEV